MLKLTEVIKSIALQSGVAETEIKDLLDNAALESIEVQDAVSTKLTAPRLSMDAAKNNPDLKKHFTALALNGIDAELKRNATELGFTPEDITELDGLESTSKRVNTMLKKVQALEASKTGKGSADVEKLNKQIESLNADILKVKTDAEAALKQKDESLETERTDWALNSILSNYDYATGVDKDINIQVAKTLLTKAYQEKGLKITRENNALVFKTAEGTDYFDNNAKVSVNDFATKVLANAKVLKASSSTTSKPATQTVITNNNPIKNADSVAKELADMA